MARQETIITAFLASPNDVEEERLRVEEAIKEINTTWSRNLGLRIELIKWETHTIPGFGDDSQSVINEQLPEDFDLFIGIMWYRFGTPTGRFGSGTEEEFNLAKSRQDKGEEAVHIMMYFKDSPPPMPISKLDTGQLQRVSEFRQELIDKGGLVWSFNSTDELERLVRLHLSRYVQQWRQRDDNTAA